MADPLYAVDDQILFVYPPTADVAPPQNGVILEVYPTHPAGPGVWYLIDLEIDGQYTSPEDWISPAV